MLVLINYWIEKCTVKHWNVPLLFRECAGPYSSQLNLSVGHSCLAVQDARKNFTSSNYDCTSSHFKTSANSMDCSTITLSYHNIFFPISFIDTLPCSNNFTASAFAQFNSTHEMLARWGHFKCSITRTCRDPTEHFQYKALQKMHQSTTCTGVLISP